jgi:PPOX class probable F420-dependent enzyme
MAAISNVVRQFLEEKRFAVLATIAQDGTPHLTTMWYELRDDTIVMNTRAGNVKSRQLRRDGRCSVCFPDGYHYVTIEGVATLDDAPATAQADIRRLAIRYQGDEVGEQRAREYFAKQQRVSIYVPIQSVITYGLEEGA